MSYNRNLAVGIAIVAIGLVGVLYYNFFSTRDIGIERAEGIAERYLESLNDPDLADVKEVPPAARQPPSLSPRDE